MMKSEVGAEHGYLQDVAVVADASAVINSDFARFDHTD